MFHERPSLMPHVTFLCCGDAEKSVSSDKSGELIGVALRLTRPCPFGVALRLSDSCSGGVALGLIGSCSVGVALGLGGSCSVAFSGLRILLIVSKIDGGRLKQ